MLQYLKNKSVLVLLLFFLVLLLCYRLAISNTLSLREEYLHLKKEEQAFKNIPQQLNMFSKKEIYLDSVLRELNLNNTSMENNLLRVINNEAVRNNIKVIDFNPSHLHSIKGTSLVTHNFTLRGNFTDILKFIHTIERQSGFGEVVHINLNKEKNYRTGKNYLDATVFIQNLE